MGSEFCQWGHHGLHIGGIWGIIPKQFSCPWGKPPSGHVCFCVLLVSCGELCMFFVYCRNQHRPTDFCFVFGLAGFRQINLIFVCCLQLFVSSICLVFVLKVCLRNVLEKSSKRYSLWGQ